MPTDSELLRQHVTDGVKTAFTELVQRYAGLVHSTALRLGGGHAGLAEEIVQDVFILLARKAPMLARHDTLAGWLHTTTRYVALRKIRNQRRREAREREALAMPTDTAPEIPWEQLRPLLDEAVGQLNEHDRNAVLLRYFQGCSHREVGATLGLSEDAARVRTERAVEKLRRHFARGGVVTSLTLLAEALSANTAQAAPTDLAGKVATAVQAQKLGFHYTLLKALYMTTKTKIIIAAAAVLALAALPLAIHYQQGAPTPPAKASAKPADTRPQVAVASSSPNVAAPGADAAPTEVPLEKPAAPAATSTATGIDPRAPLPGVYPHRPKLSDLAATARLRGGTITPAAMNETMMRTQYGNLMQKMRFTTEQADMFIKILLEQQDQERLILLQNQFDPDTSAKLRARPLDQQQSMHDDLDKRLAQLNQAVEQNTQAQLLPLLGTPENIDYYQTYTNQNKERTVVAMGYAQSLESAGIPPLTLDQEEQLVALVYNYRVALNGTGIGGVPIPPDQVAQMLAQAGEFLSPDQIGILERVLPSLTSPYHASSLGG